MSGTGSQGNLAELADLQASGLSAAEFRNGGSVIPSGFNRIVQWQSSYLPAYLIWAALVVVLFPPVFGFH